MNQTFEAILIYCLWSLFLTLIIITLRSFYTLTGKKAANSFACTGEDVSEFSQRLIRAHANCYENLPVAIGIFFTAILLGQENITNSLALIFVALRILQSITHLINTSVIAVYIRFSFFIIQILILFYWGLKLLLFTY